MNILRGHRERRARLQQAMDNLESLHEEMYALWERFMALRDGDKGRESRPKQKQIHSEIASLTEKILNQRREVFGEVSRVSELNINSRVESILLSSPAEPHEVAA